MLVFIILKDEYKIKMGIFDKLFEDFIILNKFNLLLIKMNLSIKSIIFMSLILATVFAEVTYAPAPTINSTVVINFDFSTPGDQFMTSKRIESFQISYPDASTTKFYLNFFNRSDPSNFTRYELPPM
jgi:hypothetical protein